MKHIAFACGVLALSACAQNAEINSRNSDLPGIQTTIDCNPEPTLVYAKTGQLIEKIMPILHPSCKVASSRAAVMQAGAEERPSTDASFRSRLANMLKLGPATYSRKSKLEADDSNIGPVAANAGSSDDASSSGGENEADEASSDGSAPTGGTSTSGGSGSLDNSSPDETTSDDGSASQEDGSNDETGSDAENNSDEESGSSDESSSEEENGSNDEGNSNEETSSEESENAGAEEETSSEDTPRVLTKIEELKQLAGVPF